MLPHHAGVEQMECSTTGKGATWRTEGVVPQSVEKSQRRGRMVIYSIHGAQYCVVILTVYASPAGDVTSEAIRQRLMGIR